MVVVPMVDDELAVGAGIVELELGTGPQEGQRADEQIVRDLDHILNHP